MYNLIRWTVFLPITLWLLSGPIRAQEQVSPYNARTYFEAEQNTTYIILLYKSESGETLSYEEEKFLSDYSNYLAAFYKAMSDEEKSRYLRFKTQWKEEMIEKQNQEDSDVLVTNRLGINPGKKFLLSNGIYGFVYGLGALYVFNIQESWSIAVPFLSAGISLAYPLMNSKKFEGIDYSTVMMARHGKFIGLLDGTALGLLMFGDPDSNDWAGRAIIATTIAGSITLGELGFHLGKKKKMPEGKVATYKYYSLLVPYLAFSGLVVGNVDYPRVYGGTILAAGAASYFVADRIYNKYMFTRGDMLAASSFGLLSTAIGFGLTPVDERWHMLVPAATALCGTYASHIILRNSKFTSKQGWNINYGTFAGTILGLGVILAIQPESHHLPVILPAVTGMAGWALLVSKYKKQQLKAAISERQKWVDLSFHLTPQNYFINKQIKPDFNNPHKSGLPLFSLKMQL